MPNIETGLTEKEIAESRAKYGRNVIERKKLNVITLLLRQITGNPLIIILSIATVVSYFFDKGPASFYIFWMIFISIALGFWNEYSAEKTVDDLLKKISHKATVLRGGKHEEVSAGDLVIDDIVFINPGDIVPADLTLIESKNLELNEAALTGESMPSYKKDGEVNMGTIVLGGWGRGRVINIGSKTQYGKIALNASFIKPSTEFEKGLTNFSSLLVKFILALTISIFAFNYLLGKDILSALMFSLAIAVGLTPELLPVIVTISLSHGAGKLGKKHVIAKQLVAIENLGNMDVLCTDKTGTLTEGKIVLVDTYPKNSLEIVQAALICNSAIAKRKISGNPIDTAIWEYSRHHNIHPSADFKEIYEHPFDYENMGMFTIAESKGKHVLLAKGAPEEMISYSVDNKDPAKRDELLQEFRNLSNDGYRVLAIGYKDVALKEKYVWDDIAGIHVIGFLCFMDTPKKESKAALDLLHKLNVRVKILTGDNEIITRKVAFEVGVENKDILLGSDLDKMSDDDLLKVIDEVDIYARVSPEQKLRVLAVLKKKGHSVGYLGDGVNDIPSLHNADVGISVDTAVDVAKDSANIVLLRKDLGVLADGIMEGRRTFNNTIKYILMSASSNFGNMFSAAGASLFLPFLPMTPVQILLNNTFYDVSQMVIPSDNVDEESLLKPRHWDINFIRNFMLFFGPISSIFDFMTFGILYFYFKAQVGFFQTGWFIESLFTQVLVVFVIRTSRSPFFKSRPGKWLFIVSFIVLGAALALPYSSLAGSLGFVPLPPVYLLILVAQVCTYLAMVEIAKKIFLKKFNM